VEETAHQADAQLAIVELPSSWKTLQLGVPNSIGIKIVANALFLTSQEETPMLSITTPTLQLMLDYGKSTLSTGHNAVEDMHLAILLKT
jgi:hypothetical protein